MIPYSNRIPVVVSVRNLASPEVFESKLNCRFRKFESVLTVYSAGIAGCELDVSFRTLFVAGLAKISVEFRSELGSNGCQTCASEIITRPADAHTTAGVCYKRPGTPPTYTRARVTHDAHTHAHRPPRPSNSRSGQTERERETTAAVVTRGEGRRNPGGRTARPGREGPSQGTKQHLKWISSGIK